MNTPSPASDTDESRQQGPIWPQRLRQIASPVDRIRLPEADGEVPQDEEWCEVIVGGVSRRIRFHDYGEIYGIPGLYERLFYKRLKCCSPSRVASLLAEVLEERGVELGSLRVLDLGAGNGMVGDEMQRLGVREIVGVDIIEEAKDAAFRDRPGVYDDYLVTDMTELREPARTSLNHGRFNCLTCVAALGFEDIPPRAFATALDVVHTPGWIAFSIKEEFLRGGDDAFCELIDRLERDEVLRFEAYRRFRHRVSISGDGLYYVAVVARKLREVPSRFFEHAG